MYRICTGLDSGEWYPYEGIQAIKRVKVGYPKIQLCSLG